MKRAQRLVLLILFLCSAVILQLFRVPKLSRVIPSEFHFGNHPTINEGPSNETISVCLLLYDDNHFLIEWLAYHYQTLPLRRLIVATDPRSRTSPSAILHRWHPLMNITEWTDGDYFPISYRRSILKSRRYPRITDKLVLMHRYRQRFFYLNCMKQLQREQRADFNSSSLLEVRPSRRNRVAFIDVDEFLFSNRNWKFQSLLPQSKHDTGGVTIAHLLHRFQNSRALKGTCIGLPRLLVGTKIDDDNDDNDSHVLALDRSANASVERAKSAVSAIKNITLLTATWKWHEALQNHSANKAGKAIIDLSRVPSVHLQLEQIDVHRPILNCCAAEQMWTSNTNSPLVVHHYVGTLEQFTFRSDPREGKRTFSKYLQYQSINFGTIHPVDRYRWLADFVETMGLDQAKMLLEGAGHVDKSASPVLSLEESFDKLGRTIFPGAWKDKATIL